MNPSSRRPEGARQLRICITGPESTGKTTLAESLASALATEWVPEASRLYAERAGRELTAQDVEPIAHEHIVLADAAEERVSRNGGRFLVLDTDLVSTVVYARHYYGRSSRWLEEEARVRVADLYVLCDIDVPWLPDGIRDRPEARAEMLAAFVSALSEFGARVLLVRGTPEERLTLVTDALRA